jgi:cytochrome c peroxidase
MFRTRIKYHFFLAIIALMVFGCSEDTTPVVEQDGDLTDITYDPVVYDIQYSFNFPAIEQPADNIATVDGVELGRHIFYDPILSRDSTISCASCHLPKGSFTDNRPVSIGIAGAMTSRSSMSLLNVAFYNRGLFWDGRQQTIESLSLIPVEDIHEMDNTWEEVVSRMKNHPTYPGMIRKAFGIENKSEIKKEHISYALSQFQRIMVSSGMAKYDRVEAGLDVFTDEELLGRDLFFDDNPDVIDAECSHCHSVPLMTSNDYFNNGLDEAPTLTEFSDLGLGRVTGNITDNGKFRAPTLRNIFFTAPYMHDGRFNTLEEVLEHYNSGGKASRNKDPLMRPLNLTEEHKQALIAFIRTMEEPDFNDRPELQNPFE